METWKICHILLSHDFKSFAIIYLTSATSPKSELRSETLSPFPYSEQAKACIFQVSFLSPIMQTNKQK